MLPQDCKFSMFTVKTAGAKGKWFAGKVKSLRIRSFFYFFKCMGEYYISVVFKCTWSSIIKEHKLSRDATHACKRLLVIVIDPPKAPPPPPHQLKPYFSVARQLSPWLHTVRDYTHANPHGFGFRSNPATKPSGYTGTKTKNKNKNTVFWQECALVLTECVAIRRRDARPCFRFSGMRCACTFLAEIRNPHHFYRSSFNPPPPRLRHFVALRHLRMTT